MKKATIWFVVTCLFATALSFSVYYSYKVYAGHQAISGIYSKDKAGQDPYRIVVIGEEIGSPFWNMFKRGALPVANERGIDLEFWGTLRPNGNEVIKNMEIAIASKVDGIIIQAVEHPDLNKLIAVNASAAGIPVITTASDMPATSEALRKTYVGSDHYAEGVTMGKHVAMKMEGSGKVGVITSYTNLSNQELRLDGLREVLKQYPDIQMIENQPQSDQTDGDIREQIRVLLNENPDCKAFVGLNSESGDKIVDTLKQRAKIEPYQIYFFDDNMETLPLLRTSRIDGAIVQYPEEMGKKSIELILQWIEGKDIPLPNVYHTPFDLITDEVAP